MGQGFVSFYAPKLCRRELASAAVESTTLRALPPAPRAVAARPLLQQLSPSLPPSFSQPRPGRGSLECGTPPQELLLTWAPSSLHRRRHSRASEMEPKPSSQMKRQTSRRMSMAIPATPSLHDMAATRVGVGGGMVVGGAQWLERDA